MREKDLVKQIKEGVKKGNIPKKFRVADIPCLHSSPSFLSKHCIGNPQGETEHFKRISEGLYKLK